MDGWLSPYLARGRGFYISVQNKVPSFREMLVQAAFPSALARQPLPAQGCLAVY